MGAKSKSYAGQLAGAQEMLQALKKHLDMLQQRGMTQEFIDRFETSATNLVLKNSAQEEAKAALKLATPPSTSNWSKSVSKCRKSSKW